MKSEDENETLRHANLDWLDLWEGTRVHAVFSKPVRILRESLADLTTISNKAPSDPMVQLATRLGAMMVVGTATAFIEALIGDERVMAALEGECSGPATRQEVH